MSEKIEQKSRLEQIEARLAKASPGQWYAYTAPISSEKAGIPTHLALVVGRETQPAIIAAIAPEAAETEQDHANAQFIAHAPQDIAALLAVVRTLDKRRLQALALELPEAVYRDAITPILAALAAMEQP